MPINFEGLSEMTKLTEIRIKSFCELNIVSMKPFDKLVNLKILVGSVHDYQHMRIDIYIYIYFINYIGLLFFYLFQFIVIDVHCMVSEKHICLIEYGYNEPRDFGIRRLLSFFRRNRCGDKQIKESAFIETGKL